MSKKKRKIGEYSIGFTGTRKGMTPAQKHVVECMLKAFSPVEVHHGCCSGADIEFHHIATHAFGEGVVEIIGHPSTLQKGSLVALHKFAHIHKRKEPLERNKIIVRESSILFACPATEVEMQRSGTWQTIRFARKQNHPINIIWPCGTYRSERCETWPRPMTQGER